MFFSSMAVVNHAINQAQEPPMTNTHCSVCDVYFCGDIPAKQHYAGQKHAKKLKRFQITGAAASLAPAVIPPLPVKTQVGMNLEYCELCEIKFRDESDLKTPTRKQFGAMNVRKK